MKRGARGLVWVMLTTALVVMMPRTLAQRPPETHPVSTHQDIVMGWDRSALPGDVEIWAPRTLVAYEQAGTMNYQTLFFTCLSSSSAATGRCFTQDTRENSGGNSSHIPLTFTEERSGMQSEITLVASIQRADANDHCSFDYWSAAISPIWTSTSGLCAGRKRAGTALAMHLPSNEMERLVAGHWTARLSLNAKLPPDQGVASYSAVFDFTITDRNAVAIYFPQFDQIAPHIGMNLRYDPITQTVGGGTTVDMCMYDGLGSQAAYLGVTVRDSGGRAPGPSGFSAWHRDSGGTGDSERLDYNVTLDYNGTPLTMRNGVEEQLTGIDSAKLRLVVLPGMSQPVFCVDTPLRLNMPRVPIAEKQPGYYRGDLKIELRVPTGVP